MSNANRFVDKIAFVTGAASGIGKAAAVAFATEGARVAVADLTKDALRQTMDAIKDAGGEVLALACDVSQPEQVEAAVARTVEAFGRIDVAFNERRRGEQGDAGG
jgi:NAD(P)-dependent dehydrogenase (short-subunit alcohol dehydrogenase family)